MSVAVKKWVRKHSPAKGRQRTVLIELAWDADDAGRGARLSTAQLAKATGLSRSTVKRALVNLEDAQLIRRHKGDRTHCSACAMARLGAHVFDVVIPDLADVPNDDQLNLIDFARMDQDLDQGQKVDQGQYGPWTRVILDQQEELEDNYLSHLDHDERNQNGKNNFLVDETCSEPSRARAREAREAPPKKPKRKPVDPNALPDGFPDALLPALERVMGYLTFAAEHRGAPAPARAAVARAMVKPERTRKPFVEVAEEVSEWLVYGPGQRYPCRDVVARWRDSCDRQPDVVPVEPAFGAPASNGNGRAPHDRPSRFERAQAGLAALYADARRREGSPVT